MSFIEQLKNNIKNNKKGFSLLELVLAVAIFSFSSFALANMIIDSNVSTRLSADRTEALLYAKEGIEAVRSIRDNDWATWEATIDGDYGLVIDEASSTWIFDSSSDFINDKYTRTITLATNSEVATSRDVSVNISWDLTPGRIASTTLSTVFSNWPDVINSPFVIPRGLVSYWSFDDASDGTAIDSISGNDGTVTGATATTSVKGIANQAYSFNGSSNYVEAPINIDSYPILSLSVWVYLGTPKDEMVIGNDNGGFDRGIYAQSSAGVWQVWCGDTNWNTNVSLNNNGWHHVAVVYSDSDTEFYYDGVGYSRGSASSGYSGSNTLKIGRNDNAGGEAYFSGSLDNVRIYRRALTPDDITTIYNAEKP